MSLTGTAVTRIGILGRAWRATVTSHGAVVPGDGGPVLDWAIAAEDRWHRPSAETTVRQTRLGGAPVVETRVRVPHGDAVQRVFATPGPGGRCMVVMEVENASPRSIALAVTRADVLSARPPASVPVAGIELPVGSLVFPVGHAATVQVALLEEGSPGPLPGGVPEARAVAAGWASIAGRAGRIDLAGHGMSDELVAARCAIALDGAPAPSDPVGMVLATDQLARLDQIDDLALCIDDVAASVERLARRGAADGEAMAAYDAAARLLHRAGERRALGDLERIMAVARHKAVSARASEVLDPSGDSSAAARRAASVERSFAAPGASGRVMLLPEGWEHIPVGVDLAVYDLPAGPASTVSFALRWHGERPAVLWESAGDPVALTAPVAAPHWSATEGRGEALWPAPAPAGVPSAG